MTTPYPTSSQCHIASHLTLQSAMLMTALSAMWPLWPNITHREACCSVLCHFWVHGSQQLWQDPHMVVMGTRATAKNRTEVTIQYPGRLAQDQVNKSWKAACWAGLWGSKVEGTHPKAWPVSDQAAYQQVEWPRDSGIQGLTYDQAVCSQWNLHVQTVLFDPALGWHRGLYPAGLQVIQKKAARAVTRMTWLSPTKVKGRWVPAIATRQGRPYWQETAFATVGQWPITWFQQN